MAALKHDIVMPPARTRRTGQHLVAAEVAAGVTRFGASGRNSLR
jgi:hypothetical protein